MTRVLSTGCLVYLKEQSDSQSDSPLLAQSASLCLSAYVCLLSMCLSVSFKIDYSFGKSLTSQGHTHSIHDRESDISFWV